MICESQCLNVTPFFKAWLFLNVVQHPRDWIWFVKPISCMLACCCRPPSPTPPCVIFPKGKEKGNSYLCRVRAGLGSSHQPGRCHTSKPCDRAVSSGIALKSQRPTWRWAASLLRPVEGSPAGHEAVRSDPRQVPAARLEAWIALNAKPLGRRLTPTVIAGGKDGVLQREPSHLPQGQCHSCSLWTFCFTLSRQSYGLRTGQ